MSKSFRDKIRENKRGGWDYVFGGDRLIKGNEEDWENNPNTILGGNKGARHINGRHRDNINYNVVRRWLRAQVGRPWNDVKHDMTLDTRSMSDHVLHNFRHAVDYMVEEKVMETPDGLQDYRGFRIDGLFVLEGVLKFQPRKKYKRSEPMEITRREISKELVLEKNNGIWYRVEKRPVTENNFTIMTPHGVVRMTTPITTYVNWEEVSRRTLSSKELKKHNLANDPELEISGYRK
jgi:hypothetical protein